MRRLVNVEGSIRRLLNARGLFEKRPKSLGKSQPARDVQATVEAAYARAREPDCCDPRDLAEGLGLKPCPASIEQPCLRNGILYYPENAAIDLRGLGLYYELSLFLSPYANCLAVMDELILPTRTAKRLTVPELQHVQPHAPFGRVLTIYMRHGQRSGQWQAIR